MDDDSDNEDDDDEGLGARIVCEDNYGKERWVRDEGRDCFGWMGDKVGQGTRRTANCSTKLESTADGLDSKRCVTPSCGEARPEGEAGVPPRSVGMVCRHTRAKGASGTEQDDRHSRGEALGHSLPCLVRMAMLPWVPPSRLRSALPLLPGPPHGYAASSARVALSMPRPHVPWTRHEPYGVRGTSGRPMRDGTAVDLSFFTLAVPMFRRKNDFHPGSGREGRSDRHRGKGG